MAYNRENLLRRIIEIQDLVLMHKRADVPQVIIWRKYVADSYHISYSCFNNYLSVPAKKELKELLERKQYEDKQLKLF